MSYDEFMADLKTQDAVIRNIEIIGEAAKQLPYTFTVAHSDIPGEHWLEQETGRFTTTQVSTMT